MRKDRQQLNAHYLWIGCFAIALLAVGFYPTYFRPIAVDGEQFPLILHIHGLFALLWVVGFLVQATLVRKRQVSLHRTLGIVGFLIAVGVFVTLQMAVTKFFYIENATGVEPVNPNFLGPVIDSFVFLGFVLVGIAKRNSPETHKRMMLLATIYILWVAWFRLRHYFPPFPGSDELFGFYLPNSVIVLVWIREKLTRESVHPAMLIGGVLAIAVAGLQILSFGTETWNQLATAAYHAMPYY